MSGKDYKLCISSCTFFCVAFNNMLVFVWWKVGGTTPNFQAAVPPPFGYPILFVQYTRSYPPPHHTCRPSPPSATWGRAMPWWQGTHLTHNTRHYSRIKTLQFSPPSSVLQVQLTVAQPVKKLPAFYGTRRFITDSQSPLFQAGRSQFNWTAVFDSVSTYTYTSQILTDSRKYILHMVVVGTRALPTEAALVYVMAGYTLPENTDTS
jgi:hypothetical protein